MKTTARFLCLLVFLLFNMSNSKAQWTEATSIYGGSVSSLASDGTNIFAGTYLGGVFLSTNNGSNWTAVNTGLTNTTTQSIAINGANVFVCAGGGVFLSTNNGNNWTAVNTGLTNLNVHSIAFSGTNIFAGTYVALNRASHGAFSKPIPKI